MTLSKLINEILSEWAYRVEDGMPDVKNPTHLNELGIVLSEMGLSHIKNDLVKNLTEAEEGGFKNPALNKKINYKNAKGEDAEGIVGNLLRLPAEHPGRKAAERTLPPEGSEERDALNKDLGGEGQPTKPEEPKGKEGGEDKGDAEKEKQQQAQAMFDPKSDPAMGARLDKEKETLAQLAGKDEKPEDDKIDGDDVDKDGKIDGTDIKAEPTLDKVPAKFREEVNTKLQDLLGEVEVEEKRAEGVVLKDMGLNSKDELTDENKDEFKARMKKENKPPNLNLCKVTVPGTNLYCDENKGLKRDEMPQFKGKPVEGKPAAGMQADPKTGLVDIEGMYRDHLKEKGISISEPMEVPSESLKATQDELVGAQVVSMTKALDKDPKNPFITAPIYVSKDGYIVDGHHRWAAIMGYNMKNADNPIPMKVMVIDDNIDSVIPDAIEFADGQGIERMSGKTAGKDLNKKEGPAGGPNSEPPKNEPGRPDTTPKTEMKEELFPMIDSLIEGIINDFIKEANPKGKANPSKEHPGYYHRGGGYYSKQPDGEITHKSDRGTLRALTSKEKAAKNKTIAPPVKGKKPAPTKTVAQDKDLQARASREKAALAKDKKQTATPTPKPKAAPSGKISNKMEEDDVFFSKKKVQDKLKDVNNVISKLPMNKNEKKVLFGIVGKALRGEELTKAERKFASDWVTFPATSDPKIYFAPAKGEFKTHIKVELGKGIEDRDSFNEYLERNEIFDAGHAVRKKSMVASNLTKNRKPVKVEGIEKDKDGRTQSCKIGNTTFRRYPEPDENELLDQFKKRGITNPEEEVRKTLIAIKRHNEYVEFIASQEDIETIDFGYDTDTPDGRKNTIESIKKMMFNKLNADFGKFFKGKIPPDAKNILNLIKNISNPYNGISPERMQQEIDAIAKLMNANPEFRAGVPDMQEIFDFMVKLGQGYAGFMPSASNWKVTDIVTYKPSQEIRIKKGESPAEAIANNFQNIISTSLIEGGLSVKYEKGGASAGYDKVLMTRYKKHKNFDTQKEILTLFDTYKWSFTPGEENRVKSAEEIDAKEAELNSVLERAKKAGILTEEQITEIQMEGDEQAARMAAKVEKKVPFKNFKQCFGKTDKEQKANYENYKKQCGMWCKMGAIAEALNNNDMDYQLFGNLRTVYPKKGEPRHETIDGVSTLSGMGWSYDPGIAATGKECKYLSLNNANSSHIEPIKR